MLFPEEAEETQIRQEAGGTQTNEEVEGIQIPWEEFQVELVVLKAFQLGTEEANLILKGYQDQWGSEEHCLA